MFTTSLACTIRIARVSGSKDTVRCDGAALSPQVAVFVRGRCVSAA